LQQLRSARVLNLAGIRAIPLRRLEQLIRSSGYFRQKATRIKNFVRFLDKTHGGSLTRMFAQPTSVLREQLLSLNGVGPETADSILLYAGQHASFVVDAYTKRIADRHGILPAGAGYEDLRALFQRSLRAVELVEESTTDKPGGASHESGFAFSPGAGVQRNARSAGRSRQEILPEIGAEVRAVSLEPSSIWQWQQIGEIKLASIAPDRFANSQEYN
jgi:hypothetical protein